MATDSGRPTENAKEDPTVLILTAISECETVKEYKIFRNMYKDLKREIRRRANVIISRTADDTSHHLKHSSVSAVIITNYKHWKKKLLQELKEYVSNGGACIFGSSFVAFEEASMKNFFEDNFGLPWIILACATRELQLNEQALTRVRGSTATLPHSYAQTCVFLNGVQPDDGLYIARPERTLQVSVNESKRMEVVLKSDKNIMVGVALAEYEAGIIGYVGGTNGGDAYIKVFLAMCGLQDS